MDSVEEEKRVRALIALTEDKLKFLKHKKVEEEKIAAEGLKKIRENEEKQLTDIEKVAEETLRNQIRAQERLRENVAKTTKEQKLLN